MRNPPIYDGDGNLHDPGDVERWNTAAPFHLGDILTVTTGKFMPPDGIGSIYDLLNHMTGDNLFTHQLPRACDECKPELLRQHPDLADVEPPEFTDEAHVWSWLAEQTERFGTHRDVQPLPSGEHTRINPLDELAMNYPHLAVVPVVPPDQQRPIPDRIRWGR